LLVSGFLSIAADTVSLGLGGVSLGLRRA